MCGSTYELPKVAVSHRDAQMSLRQPTLTSRRVRFKLDLVEEKVLPLPLPVASTLSSNWT